MPFSGNSNYDGNKGESKVRRSGWIDGSTKPLTFNPEDAVRFQPTVNVLFLKHDHDHSLTLTTYLLTVTMITKVS